MVTGLKAYEITGMRSHPSQGLGEFFLHRVSVPEVSYENVVYHSTSYFLI